MPQTDVISQNEQLINAVSRSSNKCAETQEISFFHGHTCIQQSKTETQTDRQTDRQTKLETQKQTEYETKRPETEQPGP